MDNFFGYFQLKIGCPFEVILHQYHFCLIYFQEKITFVSFTFFLWFLILMLVLCYYFLILLVLFRDIRVTCYALSGR